MSADVNVTAQRLRGAAALVEALDCIGVDQGGDQALAKIVVDNELALRALLAFALEELSRSV